MLTCIIHRDIDPIPEPIHKSTKYLPYLSSERETYLNSKNKMILQCGKCPYTDIFRLLCLCEMDYGYGVPRSILPMERERPGIIN
jgi:hypothetical protein